MASTLRMRRTAYPARRAAADQRQRLGQTTSDEAAAQLEPVVDPLALFADREALWMVSIEDLKEAANRVRGQSTF